MNILNTELIGLPMVILEATNKQIIGLSGTIVDETKSTFVIMVDGKKKRVMKKDVTVRIGKYIIKGKLLVARPEERIKVKR